MLGNSSLGFLTGSCPHTPSSRVMTMCCSVPAAGKVQGRVPVSGPAFQHSDRGASSIMGFAFLGGQSGSQSPVCLCWVSLKVLLRFGLALLLFLYWVDDISLWILLQDMDCGCSAIKRRNHCLMSLSLMAPLYPQSQLQFTRFWQW